MAERLKSKLFETRAVDIIAGPDALRSIPGLIDLFIKVCSCLCSAGLDTWLVSLHARSGHVSSCRTTTECSGVVELMET